MRPYNIHNELVAKHGYRPEFAVGAMRTGMRYIAVQFQLELKEILRNVTGGEMSYVTVLASQVENVPVALCQFYPAAEDGMWYFAMLKVEERTLNALSKPQLGAEIKQFVVTVRNKFFKDQLDGSLWYSKFADDRFARNPYCKTTTPDGGSYWMVLADKEGPRKAPDALDFIADAQEGFVPNPPPKKETPEELMARALRNGADADESNRLGPYNGQQYGSYGNQNGGRSQLADFNQRNLLGGSALAGGAAQAPYESEIDRLTGLREAARMQMSVGEESRLTYQIETLRRQQAEAAIRQANDPYRPGLIYARPWPSQVFGTLVPEGQTAYGFGGAGLPTKAAAPKTPPAPEIPKTKWGRMIQPEEEE